MSVNRLAAIVLLSIGLVALAGCQSAGKPKMTVIAPAPTADNPQPKWVKRGNVYYLHLERED